MIYTVYDDMSLSHNTVIECHKRYRNGRDSVEDDPREGRPCTKVTGDNVSLVRKPLARDQHLNFSLLAVTLNISFGSMREIVCISCVIDADATRMAINVEVRCIGAFAQQCTCAFINYCGAISRQKRSHRISPSTLLVGSGPSRLLPDSAIESGTEEDVI